MICNLCPRRCNADRSFEKNDGGFCKSPLNMKITRAELHFWEEPVISGKNGSGTVFFSGCSLGCVYCQNSEISRAPVGKSVTPYELAEIFKELENKGANNINLVTGDHYAYEIKKAFQIYRPKIPVVLNSGGYISEEQLNLLGDYIDIYLLDFKYISAERAKKYSFAEDYPLVAKKAIEFAVKKQPDCLFDENGIMQKGVIIRHLLMPLATNEAIKIFDFVKETAPNAYFSIMGQYLPLGTARDFPEINRKVTSREYQKVVDFIAESGFENCFVQELSSADKKFIPDFDV